MEDRRTFIFPPPPTPAIPIHNDNLSESPAYFPVHRIYCVGRNYAEHAKEMGGDPNREPPFFFTKPHDAVVFCDPAKRPTRIPYPLATSNLHHEIELVIAIGKEGTNISPDDAPAHIFGYAVGVDLTRRDLQAAAKEARRPWDSAKGFDYSAPIGPIYPSSTTIDDLESKHIWLQVNGGQRQSGVLMQMTWSVPRIVSFLSQQFNLVPGDLIFTGTPSGVGPIGKEDIVVGGCDGFGTVEFKIE